MSLFRMPSLGSDMERAVLIEWLVEPGSEVRRGDLVAVVETDKGAIEIEIFEDGCLERYLVALDTEVAVGEPLAEIRGAGTDSTVTPLTSTAPKTQPFESVGRPTQPAAHSTAPSASPAPISNAIPSAPGHSASPAARRLAHEHGVDITTLPGTGPEGAIVYEDVARLIASAPQQPVTRKEKPDAQSNMRRAIAAAMARSKREIPHYYLGHTVDIEPAMQWLKEVNANTIPGQRILASAMFIKAAALALRKFPDFNGLHEAGEFKSSAHINIGVAIAIRGGGLVAPAIHQADLTPLQDLMAHLRDLTRRVRAGRFRAAEIRDPTITITSLGDRGVEQVYGVIYPPQVACIGFGKVLERPWSMPDGSVTSRQTVHIGMAADHRVSDGRRGGLLINTIAELLQKPEEL